MADIVRAEIPMNAYGVPVVGKRPTATMQQGQPATLEWIVRDSAGNPLDLQPYAGGTEPRIRVAESIEFGMNGVTDLPAVVTDAEHGVMQADIPAGQPGFPGIYVVEASLNDADGVVLRTYSFFLCIERSLYGAPTAGGPPSIAEIRLHLRDNAPEDNELIDRMEFDASEIAAAIIRPIQYWNESLPPVAPMTTSTFIHRYHWLEGIVANLFITAANHYRRNRLAYTAGGMTVDAMNKEQEYLAAGLEKWKNYQEWVRARKVGLNIQLASGQVGSAYRYLG